MSAAPQAASPAREAAAQLAVAVWPAAMSLPGAWPAVAAQEALARPLAAAPVRDSPVPTVEAVAAAAAALFPEPAMFRAAARRSAWRLDLPAADSATTALLSSAWPPASRDQLRRSLARAQAPRARRSAAADH